MRKFLLALALALGLTLPAEAAVSALRGPSLAISNATNASPIVVTDAANTFAINDWVVVAGVQGNTAANGLWQCSAVSGTTCTLSGSVGNGAYTAGGTIQSLGATATYTSAWYDVSQADRCFAQVWSLAGAAGSTVVIEQSANPTGNASTDPNRVAPPTPSFIAASIVAPSATGELWSVPCTGVVRIRVSVWSAGSIYGVIEAYRGNARIW